MGVDGTVLMELVSVEAGRGLFGVFESDKLRNRGR